MTYVHNPLTKVMPLLMDLPSLNLFSHLEAENSNSSHTFFTGARGDANDLGGAYAQDPPCRREGLLLTVGPSGLLVLQSVLAFHSGESSVVRLILK